ncbi:hypothetical protein C8R48DRAFT_605678 [Suillus tomentosus]|nr:hypothetical protein C8R48DRAFT_605678 [Suillus tomentosus]
MDGHDALLVLTISQAHKVDQCRHNEPTFDIGDLVYDSKKVTKVRPFFDRPYNIVSANIDLCTYMLDLQDHQHIYTMSHASALTNHVPNDCTLYYSRELQ